MENPIILKVYYFGFVWALVAENFRIILNYRGL